MQASGAATPVLFGPLARALEPRGLPAASSPEPTAESLPARRLAFSVRGGEESARALASVLALASVRSSVHRPDTEAAGGESELHLACDRPVLEALAAADPAAALLLATSVALERPPAPPRLMGIVNVTPDSFSDGGLFLEPERAVEHALALVDEGALLIDVGGESTRPGAAPVPESVELERVVPVVAALAATWRGTISVDTRRARVAAAALDAGARLVNDVSAGRADPGMLPLVAERRVDICLMHMLGEPATMQRDPRYGDVVADVMRFLRDRVIACLNAGIDLPRIMLDPGIGFGKRVGHNLELLRRLAELRSLSLPVLVGVSRKSFIAHVNDRERAQAGIPADRMSGAADRIGGTAAAIAACVRAGVDVLRVHDVGIMLEATRVARAIAFPASTPTPST
jgi:dihydropteroate synthase